MARKPAIAQLESSSVEIVTITGSEVSISGGEAPVATLPSDFERGMIVTASLTSAVSGSTPASNATASGISSEATYTQLVGGTRSSSILSGNTTATTSTAAAAVNTQSCLCAQQLEDGIRMLQGQTHYVNGTLYYCHTSCDQLNAGTVEDYLRTVTNWVAAHPFDVIMILFGNYNYQDRDADGTPLGTSNNLAEPIETSGLLPCIYQPPKTAMTLEDWSTLGS